METAEQAFRCDHGTVFARCSQNGGYSGCAPEDVCLACAWRAEAAHGGAEGEGRE